MEKNHCKECEYRETCDDADMVNFCDECRDFKHCPIKSVFALCKAGYYIECNNGFEEKL